MSHGHPRVERFPWGELEGLTRAEVAAGRRMAEAVRRFVSVGRVPETLGALLGVRVEALLKTVREASPAALPSGAVGVLLAPSDRARVHDGARVLLVVEPALAATLAARALGRAPPTLLSPALASAPPSAELSGALAAVARAVAARAHAGSSPVVLFAGPAAPPFLELARGGTSVVAHFTLLVDDEAFTALVVVDARSLPRAGSDVSPPGWSFSRAALEALGPIPLALRVVAASCVATVGELARLAPGDALLTGLAASGPPARGVDFAGRVVLVAPRGDVGIVADLQGSARLVLSAERVAMPLVANDAPGDFVPRGGYARMDSNDLSTEVLAEVPLVVRVELGAAELTASAWAKARSGDVIALGRNVGEPVVLRVSGTEVARGELVSLEGELAVRILSRTGEVAS